jgi:hypothetical protein
VEYKLISGNSNANLNKEVNAHLKEGWELYGDPAVVVDQSSDHISYIYCFQAMTKQTTTTVSKEFIAGAVVKRKS